MTIEYRTTASSDNRVVALQAVALPGDRTAMRADATVRWLRLRTASDHVPSAIDRVRVVSTVPHHTTRVVIVSTPGRVRPLVHILNDLTLVQPGLMGCPMMSTATPAVRVTLLRDHRRIATARLGSLAPCYQVRLAVGHGSGVLLLYANALRRWFHRLGIDLLPPATGGP